MTFSHVLFSQDKGEYLLHLGLNYPKIGFVDSHGNQSLSTDFNNISSNHLSIGYKDNVSGSLGFILSFSSNRYDVLARYGSLPSNYNYVSYNLDYLSTSFALAFDLKLTNHLYIVPHMGLRYNYLMSGFQNLNGNIYDLKENEDYMSFSISAIPGVYLTKKISHFTNIKLGYLYDSNFRSQEQTTMQSYDLNNHTVYVGASFNLGAFKSDEKKSKQIENKLVKLSRSFNMLHEGIDSIRLYVDSVFISSADLNAKLQSEIESYITSNNESFKPSGPDFVILFPSDSARYYELFNDSMLELLDVALLESTLEIKIVGYTDVRGHDQSNLILSKNRTETIKNYLVQKGVDSSKISVEFLGETSLFDSNVLMSNRRVEIFIKHRY